MNGISTQIGARISGFAGRRRLLFAFVAGALSALGFAPFKLFFMLLAGFAVLVLLIDGAKGGARPMRSAFGIGWCFGFGQFLVGLHWIGYAFWVDAENHAWQLPFVALLFPGGLAIFPAAAMAAAVKFWRNGPSRIFVFALAYGLCEWLRGHLFTGFPWNIAAYGWGASLGVLQSTALVGTYGLSLLTVLFGASLAELCRAKWRLPAVMAGVFLLMGIGGNLRLALTDIATVKGVRLRIVQPDIPQAEKYKLPFIARNWQLLTDLSTRYSREAPTIVIWPEAAPPFLITRYPQAMDWVAALNAKGTLLMTGAIRGEREENGEARYFNSFYIFAHGTTMAVYDKAHLVPFGEYLPFEHTLETLGLKKLTGISGSFGQGDGPHTFEIPDAPAVGPLICYEALFPGEVAGSHRPNWFVNVTDDSWFGPWAGPKQHLLAAQVRAIEEGVPVVRAANTGISAIIDPLGRITARLKLNKSGVLEGGLPSIVDRTPYSQLPALWFWLIAGVLFLLAHTFSGKKLTQRAIG
jgi:apolipoprotein N-acyltransferase